MKITATGWRRDMGPKELGEPTVKHAVVLKNWPDLFRQEETYLKTSDKGVEIKWHAKLSLTGDYQISMRLGKSEIMALFNHAFGTEISPDTISKMGAHVDDAIIAERLAAMTLDDLYHMLSSRRAAA